MNRVNLEIVNIILYTKMSKLSIVGQIRHPHMINVFLTFFSGKPKKLMSMFKRNLPILLKA